MRQIFIISTLLAMVVACNNSNTATTESHAQAAQQIDTTKLERQVLIEQLKKFHQTIASNDKEKIADLFPFPLSDTAFGIFIDDSTYNKQFAANGNKLTRAMFLQYFKDISASIWLDQMNDLFKHIHVDSLLQKDTLVHEDYIATEPCFYSYEIDVAASNVTFRINSNSNEKYKTKQSSEDDIPENSSEICDHNFWWIFKFDGKTLHLENVSGAD